MTKYVLLLSLFCFSHLLLAQETLVFEADKEGHAIYRIPAIINLPNGELLAFAEGRVNGTDDFGDINLVMKRSNDRGENWSNLETLVDYDSLQAGNPAPVVDLHNPEFPDGVVFLFYNTGNNHEYDIRMNRGVRETWMITSFDLGKSWTTPENITTQVHLPNNPDFNPEYQNPEDWRHYANTPGHAFQFQHGPHQGRIYVAANHSAGDPISDWSDYQAHGFFTDDHGQTFSLSESVKFGGSNESIAAELTHGRMIMSSRNQKGDIRQRILSYSSDGGQTWEESYFEPQLPDPVCQASILNIGAQDGKTILAHSNAASEEERNHLTIKISYDEGKTWTKNILIDSNENGEKNAWTAYSDLVNLDKNTLGILYERDNYRQIVFKSVKWK
ncbi:sialidase family protein [Algoriphagus hitonicola]|uniref:exo-alpha-sialidase n=1 Tax=Algoriphagus hitonicola TaxID=435880 RepID=A0A1I2NSB9_9BACT|nr:sialidase family protein [Algoriphagus hitonicola]SFG06483.1 sialidase-1 [Algoriphagus hitonicola]